MSKPKLTPWFWHDNPPCRRGVYEVISAITGSHWHSYFDGKNWHGCWEGVIEANRQCNFPRQNASFISKWRGLAVKP